MQGGTQECNMSNSVCQFKIEDILVNTPPLKRKISRAYTHIKSIFSSGKSLNIPVVISNGNTCKT